MTNYASRSQSLVFLGTSLYDLENSGVKGLIVAPYLMLGKTDSGLYSKTGAATFRFMPFRVNRTAGDLSRIHGINERLSQASYLDGIQFYMRLLQLAL